MPDESKGNLRHGTLGIFFWFYIQKQHTLNTLMPDESKGNLRHGTLGIFFWFYIQKQHTLNTL